METTCIHCGWKYHCIPPNGYCYSCNKYHAMKPFPIHHPSTQKAKGIMLVSKQLHSLVGYISGVSTLNVFGLFKVAEPLEFPEWLKPRLKAGMIFARPCPPVPEHGFVESRVVKTEEQLEDLRLETLKADPESEIILTELIKADTNSVLVPTLLSIGKGHDGATAGKDTLNIPLVGNTSLKKEILKEAGIKDGEVGYIEAVTSGDQIYLTQLRGGPPLGQGISQDYIPKLMKVQKVVKTKGEDLLEWRDLIKSLKDVHGLVIWHPGGSPIDHYSVHCRVAGVPIITSFKPAIGKILKPTKDEGKWDANEIVRGIATADKMNLYTGSGYCASKYIALALLALHNSPVLTGKASFFIGMGLGTVAKLGAAALEAEARYAHNCFKNMKGKPQIYNFYASKSLSFLRARLSRITQLLHYGFGNVKNFKGGYGGPKWALCGAALCPVFNSIKQIVDNPTEENAKDCLDALNVAINQAHNGGWWLNKFIEVNAYDVIPKGNIGWTLVAGNGAWDAWQNAANQEDVKKLRKQIERWPDRTTIKPLSWRKASVDISAGMLTLTLKASTLPKPITVQVASSEKVIEALTNGSIDIHEDHIILTNGEKKTVLWREHKLKCVAREVK